MMPALLSPERWKALEPLLDAALELAPDRRSAFFEQVSLGDSALSAELEHLVEACGRTDPVLDRQAAELFASLFEETSAVVPPALGEQYEIERELGRGGMATVYLAYDRRHDRRVAIKVLRPELAALVGAERFLAEIRVTARLQHPHLLPLFDSGQTGSREAGDWRLYYVMPYVAGESLRARLEREGRLRTDDALRIATEVASALDYAHRQGVVHRDIKPENILLAEDSSGAGQDHTLVADFGIARAVSRADTEGTLTGTGVAVGTPRYMSPEQALGQRDLDGRSDIYSLGCVLYEMLAGEPPVTGRNAQAILTRTVRDPAPSLRQVRPDVPVPLERAISKALANAPDDRFASAADFAASLQASAKRSSSYAPGFARLRWTVSRRALIRLALSATAIAVVVGAAWDIVRRLRPIGEALSPDRVAVLPFTVRGGNAVAYLGDGMVDLLTASLDGGGNLRTVDARAVLSVAAQEGTGPPDLPRAQRIARRLGAGRFVLGGIVAAGPRHRVNAALYATDDTSEPLARSEAEGSADGLFALVDEITSELLVGARSGAAAQFTLAQATTPSLTAVKAYLQGENEMRVGRYRQARDAFREAVTLDSLFALGWYRLAVASAYLPGAPDGPHGLAQAGALKGRLSERYRLLVAAAQAHRAGRADEGERLYRTVLIRYPDDIEALIGLGNLLFEYAGFRGRPVGEARVAYERALAIEPTNVRALNIMRVIPAVEGDSAVYDSLMSRWLKNVGPQGSFVPAVRLELALLRRDTVERERLLAEIRASPGGVPGALVNVQAFVRNLPEMRSIARIMTDPSHGPDERADGHIQIAYVELALGRWRAAREQLVAAEALDSVYALEHRGVLSLHPFADVARGELERLRARLARSAPPDSLPNRVAMPPLRNVHEGLHRHIRLYLLAVLSTRLGDGVAARRYSDSLARLGGSAEARSFARGAAMSARAEQDLAAGRLAEALRTLEQSRAEVPWTRGLVMSLFSGSHDNYVRAELLARLGRTSEALRWYRARMPGRFAVAYTVPSLLGAAKAYEQIGQREEAMRAYSVLVDLWKDCDPNLRPVVQDAKERLGRLGAQ